MITHGDETNYFLPEDGAVAKQDILNLLKTGNIKEIYICAYNFSQTDIFAAIKDLDAKNIPIYMLLDNVQAHGPSEWNSLIELHKTLQHATITLTTAGANSPVPGTIWHSKAFTVTYNDGTAPYNWMGSVNFSDTGFDQGNTARKWRDQEWSDTFIQQWHVHNDWALQNRPEKQISYILEHPINTESFDEENYSEDNEVFIDHINVLNEVIYRWQCAAGAFALIALIEAILLWR